ncbi:MAG: helix-turn-helix domain-containing protein [Brachybacterium sp.]|nr:helix-turn-helix domain-containing protein [Brachybacterium sp.]
MSSGAPSGEDGTGPVKVPVPPAYASRDQLRAMAHPLRLDIVERVGRRGTARAADVAADLEIPANSVSYHLRILARGGVIEEAPEAARDRRDRVWRLAQSSFHLERRGADSLNDPEASDADYRSASGAATLATFEWMRSAWSAEIARSQHPDTDPADGLGVLSATSLRLSREQMGELNQLFKTKLQEYSQLNRDEHGTDLPGDPDSDGEAIVFRALWVSVGEQAPEREAGTSVGDPGVQRPEDDASSSSTASPS